MTEGRFHCPKRTARDLYNARLLLGKRLGALLHDQYYFNGERSLGDVGSLEWRFGDQEVLSMYLLSDGESVGADSSPLHTPVAFEIEPNVTCSWRRENLLEGLSAKHLEGKAICGVEGVIDVFDRQTARMVGFKITFETGDVLIFLNQGDDAVMLMNALPPRCSNIETLFVSVIE